MNIFSAWGFFLLCASSTFANETVNLPVPEIPEELKQGKSVSRILQVSPDSQNLFVIHRGLDTFIFPEGDISVQAQLYTNDQGKFVPSKFIPLEISTFFFTDGGGITPDFSNFIIIDNDGNANLRIRLFDSNLQGPLATKVFASSVLQDGKIVFTNEGKFFGMGLQIESDLFFCVFKTETLEKVAEQKMGSVQNLMIQSPNYIKYKKKKGKIIEFFSFNLTTHDSYGKSLSSKLQFLKFTRKPEPKLRIANQS